MHDRKINSVTVSIVGFVLLHCSASPTEAAFFEVMSCQHEVKSRHVSIAGQCLGFALAKLLLVVIVAAAIGNIGICGCLTVPTWTTSTINASG